MRNFHVIDGGAGKPNKRKARKAKKRTKDPREVMPTELIGWLQKRFCCRRHALFFLHTVAYVLEAESFTEDPSHNEGA